MYAVVLCMALTIALAALVLAYTAFPHRRERVPGVPWLGEALERATDAVPVIEDGDLDPPIFDDLEQPEPVIR